MLNYLDYMLLHLKLFLGGKIKEERGDVNVVSIVVLIAVAVVLAILLKGQLSGLIERLTKSIETKAGSILD